jgi:hypothetical protein
LCVLSGGRVIERGTPAEIKARHATVGRSTPAGPTLEDTYLALLEAARRDPGGGAVPVPAPLNGAAR